MDLDEAEIEVNHGDEMSEMVVQHKMHVEDMSDLMETSQYDQIGFPSFF